MTVLAEPGGAKLFPHPDLDREFTQRADAVDGGEARIAQIAQCSGFEHGCAVEQINAANPCERFGKLFAFVGFQQAGRADVIIVELGLGDQFGQRFDVMQAHV